MKIVILTGDETRHKYFRLQLGLDPRLQVINSYCENTEQSLANRVKTNPNRTRLEEQHVQARSQAEDDFFGLGIKAMEDRSNPVHIKKGEINHSAIVQKIIASNPDILVCYGASLIKSELIRYFEGRFLNVHLGLSPYYRGSGTNVWPLINKEPHMLGATFMYIDEGIDTGKIIHQLRAEIYLGDSPHSIGNRLIRNMTQTYGDVVAKFQQLTDERQPMNEGKLYLKKDFDGNACDKLYQNFKEGMIPRYLETLHHLPLPYIVNNQGLNQS